jgi:Domain of unknown function (DUF6134)
MAAAATQFNDRDPSRRRRRTALDEKTLTEVRMMPAMSRRTAVRSILGGGAALVLPAKAFAMPSGGEEIAFRAYRNGTEIGTHRLTFSADGDRLLVDVEIRFDVTFAFVTLYRYRHRSRETWQGTRLVALDTSTDDDGERFAVRAAAEGERLVVETAAGKALTLPGTILPTSYWHERTVEVSQWLDSQSGRLLRSDVERIGVEPIDAAGRRVNATRYHLRGDLSCELWYAEQRWSKLRFAAADGSTIDYVLESSSVDNAAWFAQWAAGPVDS